MKQLFRECQDLSCLTKLVQKGLSFSCLRFFNQLCNPFPKHCPKCSLWRETWVFYETPGENSGTWLKQYGLKMNVFVLVFFFKKKNRISLSQEWVASYTLIAVNLINFQEEKHNVQMTVTRREPGKMKLTITNFLSVGTLQCYKKLWISFCMLWAWDEHSNICIDGSILPLCTAKAEKHSVTRNLGSE